LGLQTTPKINSGQAFAPDPTGELAAFPRPSWWGRGLVARPQVAHPHIGPAALDLALAKSFRSAHARVPWRLFL